MNKEEFIKYLTSFTLTESKNWSVKCFIDVYKNIYNVSYYSKIISKILETQVFQRFKEFLNSIGYNIILTEKNWCPNLFFVNKNNKLIV